MVDWLVRLFIKDYEQIEDNEVRKAYGILAGVVGVSCNVVLFIVKAICGLLLNSISVLTDAFNNLSDAASSLIGLVSAKLSAQPADKEHPFGHGRLEYIAAFVVAFLILEVGFSCLKSAFRKILYPQEMYFSILSIVVLVGSMFVKLWIAHLNKTLGKRIHSAVMEATAIDARNDVFITGATVISLLISKITDLQLDGYIGVCVALVVLLAGITIMKDTIKPLIGEAVDKEYYQKVKLFVENYEGILGSHDLIIHSYGPSYSMATIHVEIANTWHMEEAHELIDRIEREIYDTMRILLTIHIDPVEVNDSMVLQKKQWLNEILTELEPKASMHDFRMIHKENGIHFVFDLLLPYSYEKEQEVELLRNIMEVVKQEDKRCRCIITVDHSFVAED